MNIKYIKRFVLIKPKDEDKMIIQAYNLSCWIVFRLCYDYSSLVGGCIKYYKSLIFEFYE